MSQDAPRLGKLGSEIIVSLFAQVLALVLLSIIAAEGINTWVVFHQPPTPPDFYQVTELVTAMQATTAPMRTENGQALVAKLVKESEAPRVGDQRFEKFLADEIATRLHVPQTSVRMNLVLDPRSSARQTVAAVRRLMGAPRGLVPGENHFIVGPFRLGVRQADGRWLVVEPQARGMLGGWQGRILLWFTLTSLALAPVAYLFARRFSAPIAAFAEAAERLGRDPGAQPLKPKGPAELRAAVSAFNQMQDRLRRYVDDRTAMIGAVAHDLRTPLTRLRFRVESVQEPLRSKMTNDLEQMDAMIAATMAFVRDATKGGERRRLELSSLVQSIADEMADTGHDVTAERRGPVVIDGDPIALRRLVTNLLDNAVKFGGRARARVYTEDSSVVIEVDDDGPGVAASDKERVFEPFYRGEPSRSRETGGAGLGLAVVRSVARAHGGDAALENRPGGGLRARARLPI